MTQTETIEIPNHFHNTNRESGTNLVKSEEKAKHQDEIVFDYFQKTFPYKFSPEEIWKRAFDTNNVPLTSIRRAFTNLTNQNRLIKTTEQVTGIYGKKICLWKLYIKETLF